MFENRLIEVPRFGGEKIYASRIIASWLNKGGTISGRRRQSTAFYRWCESLGIADSDIQHMITFAENGKLELEYLAAQFLKNEKVPSE